MAEQKSGNKQRGSTFWGFMGGLVVGVGVATGVALYITKVPTPFTNRNQPRTPDQDVAEQKRNSNWDPNAALYGRNPAPRPAASSPAPADNPAPTEPVRAQTSSRSAQQLPAPDDGATVDQAPPQRPVRSSATTRSSTSADPLGDLVNRTTGGRATAPAPQVAAAANPAASGGAEPYNYMLQVGAYNSMADAQSQRARLSIQGVETRISERDVNGRTVYRVRVGPFDNRADAELAKERLDAAGTTTTLLRVQR